MRWSSRRQSPARSSMRRIMRGDSTSECLARMPAIRCAESAAPGAPQLRAPAGTHESVDDAGALPDQPLRTRCSACRSSCRAVLVATNFIVGRCTASSIASAGQRLMSHVRSNRNGSERLTWASARSAAIARSDPWPSPKLLAGGTHRYAAAGLRKMEIEPAYELIRLSPAVSDSPSTAGTRFAARKSTNALSLGERCRLDGHRPEGVRSDQCSRRAR